VICYNDVEIYDKFLLLADFLVINKTTTEATANRVVTITAVTVKIQLP